MGGAVLPHTHASTGSEASRVGSTVSHGQIMLAHAYSQLVSRVTQEWFASDTHMSFNLLVVGTVNKLGGVGNVTTVSWLSCGEWVYLWLTLEGNDGIAFCTLHKYETSITTEVHVNIWQAAQPWDFTGVFIAQFTNS